MDGVESIQGGGVAIYAFPICLNGVGRLVMDEKKEAL